MNTLYWILGILAYLLFSFSAFVAVTKYFTIAHYEKNWKEEYELRDGYDLSWCDIFWNVVMALIPIGNISGNLMWFWVLKQKVNKGRPFFEWPKISFPKCKLPECPVAIRGQKKEEREKSC